MIITSYNVAPYLREAVDSALNQTVAEIEVVVIDDESSDDSLKRLSDLTDPRLRLVEQAHGGLQVARNRGVRETSAPFVAFLDGDDLWRPDKLEKHLLLMEARPDVDMSFSRSVIYRRDEEFTWPQGDRRAGPVSFEDLYVENLVRNGSAAVLRRSALEAAGEFDVELPASGDRDMWLRIALRSPDNILSLGEYLTCYRRRSGQATSGWDRPQQARKLITAKFDRLVPERVRRLKGSATMNFNRYLAELAYKAGDLHQARSFLAVSFRSSPMRFLLDNRCWELVTAVILCLILPVRIQQVLKDIYARLRRFFHRRFNADSTKYWDSSRIKSRESASRNRTS